MSDLSTLSTCRIAPACDPDDLCGLPANNLIVAGCVHEHVTREYLCLFHAADHALGATFTCRPCWLGTDPHRCSAFTREVTP